MNPERPQYFIFTSLKALSITKNELLCHLYIYLPALLNAFCHIVCIH